MIKKKSLLRTCVISAAVLFVCCFATATQATTIYVGACHTGGYATITAAVNYAAVHPAVTIIDVCPGYYAEQVNITTGSITLQGIAYAHSGVTSDAAVIVPPSGGLQPLGTILDTDDGPGAALPQVYVSGVTGVIIKNITVDGESNQSCGLGLLVGIYYENASGQVIDSAVRNQNEGGGNGDQCGFGILGESNSGSQTLTVTNTSVSNFQKNGIVARGVNSAGQILTATGNTVTGVGPVLGNAAQNGIEIAFGATGTVTSNYVADVLYNPNNTNPSSGTGILLYATTGTPTVESNTVESANYGVGIYYDPGFGGGGSGATINSNHIGGTQMFDAIDLCGANETAKSNFIYNSTESGVHLDDTCGGSSGTGDTVSGNTINEACAGLLLGTSLTNTTTPNTYYNDGYEQLAGDTCTLPAGPLNNVKGKTEGQSAKKAVKPRP